MCGAVCSVGRWKVKKESESVAERAVPVWEKNALRSPVMDAISARMGE